MDGIELFEKRVFMRQRESRNSDRDRSNDSRGDRYDYLHDYSSPLNLVIENREAALHHFGRQIPRDLMVDVVDVIEKFLQLPHKDTDKGAAGTGMKISMGHLK